MDAAQVVRKAFDGLDEAEVKALVATGEECAHEAGTVLCHEGRLEYVFYIVLEGTVAITQRFSDGGTRHLAIRGAGEFFGEMALIEKKPRAASVVTTTKTTVLEISDEHFTQLLSKSPTVAITILRSITATLRHSDQASIVDLSRKNAELAKAYGELKAAQAELVAKEKLEHELEIAATLQQNLLPSRFPDVPGWSFAGRNVPARTIGGDLFDVLQVDDDHVGLLMADVSDKSIHAALFMAVTRSLFLPESRRSLSPRAVALAVHHWLLEVSSDANMFVTAFYGVLNPGTGQLRYVRAGQDRPLWIRRGQEAFTQLDAEGRFLGMLEELDLEEREVTLSPGDVLLLYSDGVPDAVNAEKVNYGLERLARLLDARRGDTAQGICDSVFKDVFDFRGEAEAFDDITVLVAKADD
ncbi:MAG: SpoIIE family protein phosphatase [Chloroflexi bacterium]|nr:SpoIIE family protein phosphatase [Chloroflexota bacterium]